MAGYKFYSNILSNLNKNQQDITKSCLFEKPQYSRKKCIYYRNITDLEKIMCIARKDPQNFTARLHTDAFHLHIFFHKHSEITQAGKGTMPDHLTPPTQTNAFNTVQSMFTGQRGLRPFVAQHLLYGAIHLLTGVLYGTSGEVNQTTDGL